MCIRFIWTVGRTTSGTDSFIFLIYFLLCYDIHVTEVKHIKFLLNGRVSFYKKIVYLIRLIVKNMSNPMYEGNGF